MASLIKIANKTLNAGKLIEELAPLGALINGLGWAGFHNLDDRRYTPNAARQWVGRSVVDGVGLDDFADPGELRFSLTRDLTPAEETQLDSILSAHNQALLSAEQTREDQDNTDFNVLLATDRQTYINHLQNWSTYSNTQKFAATQDMFTIVGKMLRLFLRLQRGASI